MNGLVIWFDTQYFEMNSHNLVDSWRGLGTFNLLSDGMGRWMGRPVKELLFQLHFQVIVSVLNHISTHVIHDFQLKIAT